jgi:predicted anti-sigma-YlaC factor YlaD
MISCFFHRSAFRRHLDDGEELSALAKSHLRACDKCREMLAAHRAIIEHLSARRNPSPETPAFLHARIMNNLETAPQHQTASLLRWAGAAVTLAVLATAVFLSLPKQVAKPTATWPDLSPSVGFKPSIPENPLETEIQNLRADTLNAAKALATSFLPESESEQEH